MKKSALLSLLVSALTLSAAWAQDKVVNVYNWSDYIDPTVLEDFTKATGIKVVYDTYDNNEIVETRLRPCCAVRPVFTAPDRTKSVSPD